MTSYLFIVLIKPNFSENLIDFVIRNNFEEKSVCYEELSQPYWMVLLGLACLQHAFILMDIIVTVTNIKFGISYALLAFLEISKTSSQSNLAKNKIFLWTYHSLLYSTI